MEKLFVPYELAVKLKEIGFDEPCMAHYIKNNQYKINKNKILLHIGRLDYDDIYKDYVLENIPLWQQAFDWFRIKHKLIGLFEIGTIEFSYQIFNEKGQRLLGIEPISYNGTYEEVRQACLETLIKIIETKTSNSNEQ